MLLIRQVSEHLEREHEEIRRLFNKIEHSKQTLIQKRKNVSH